MAEPLRHRQTKEAATDMLSLQPPRHIPTLPVPELSACNLHVRFTTLSRNGPLRAVIGPGSQPGALLDIRFRVLSFLAAARDIFLAVDRCHMRRISIEIRSPDSKLLAVSIDPFPQVFSGNQPLCLGRASDAHDIGRKPVTIAAAE